MIALLCFFLTLFTSPFKSKSRLEAESAALRHQLTVLRRKVRGHVQLTNGDRLFLIQLYRWFPSVLRAITPRRAPAILFDDALSWLVSPGGRSFGPPDRCSMTRNCARRYSLVHGARVDRPAFSGCVDRLSSPRVSIGRRARRGAQQTCGC
jgi:hypothetical protein